MLAVVSVVLSALALAVSALTAWLTILRRGKIRMTQPTVIFLGPDGSRFPKDDRAPKAFLRTLLFSTGKRGHMIESMHLKLTRNETVQNFNIWVYGDENLVRGSGLFVGENGVATNHHFLTPKDGSSFTFSAGDYKAELFAKVLGECEELLMWSEKLRIEPSEVKTLQEQEAGIYFDWRPLRGCNVP